MEQNTKTASATQQDRIKRAKRLKKSVKKRKPGYLRRRYTAGFTLIIFVCFNLLGALLIGLVAHDRYNKDDGKIYDLLSAQAAAVAESTTDIANSILSAKTKDKRINACAQLSIQLNKISDVLDTDIVFFYIGSNSDGEICGSYFACHHKDDETYPYVYNSEENQELELDDCPLHPNRSLHSSVIERLYGNGVYSDTTDKLSPNGENQFMICRLMNDENNNPFAVVCAMTTIRDEVVDYLTPIVSKFLIAEAVTLVFAALIVNLTVLRFTTPLLQLSNAVRSYARGDFSPRVAVKRNDELGQLAEAFNQMAADLEQLESSRRNFVANVSHELKTPMTTIGGFVDGILDGTIPPEKQSDYLNIVSSEVKRLSRMVVSMLNLSRIEEGQQELIFSPVDVKKLLIEATINFDKQIEQKRLDIRGFDAMQSLMIRADKDMMSQVVYNLIDNAVKFTPKYGFISFSAALTKADRVEVRIRNSGDGIPSDERSRIFERFYKVDKSRSFDKKSSGLGLYIVKSILDLHNGSIRVESKVGKYTEFIFEVPSDISGS